MGMDDGDSPSPVCSRNTFECPLPEEEIRRRSRTIDLRRSSSDRTSSAWCLGSELLSPGDYPDPFPKTTHRLSQIEHVKRDDLFREDQEAKATHEMILKQKSKSLGRKPSAKASGVKKRDSLIRRLMRRKVQPVRNPVCSLELVLQLNPSHVATDSAERIPIVIDILSIHNLDLSMVGLEPSEIENKRLMVICCPMYMDTTRKHITDHPLADMKSDEKEAVMSGEISLENQMTMVLSHSLYSKLSKLEIRLCLVSSKKGKLSLRKEKPRVIASCFVDLLYIQREVAVVNTYQLFTGGELAREASSVQRSESARASSSVQRRQIMSTVSAIEFDYNATPSDRVI